mmetsp:Transcript_713/g.1136  ORF Transcript_713/g.1136 Transcript_713/m.1136 type:complete len:125 (+) Transcript_713:70-444(+)
MYHCKRWHRRECYTTVFESSPISCLIWEMKMRCLSDERTRNLTYDIAQHRNFSIEDPSLDTVSNSNSLMSNAQEAEQAKQVVRQYIAAFNAGDMSKLQDLLAPDAEIQDVLGKWTFVKVSPVWQ